MAGEKILVVEDEPLVAQMLADYLATLSVEVLHASNGVEALELAWEREPDLILLDVMMPKLDGFEVAGILKQNPKTRHIPVIFLTALTKVEDKVRGLELGADDYITKPFQPEELLARVTSVLRRVRAEREPTGVRGNLQAMSLLNLFDGERDIGQVLEASGPDELKALQDIARLLDRGILEPV